ncbi:hypothetical protein [Thermomonospora echinospora]|uniref:hypothetical protein n=1 Tax=Thermomonospora echinospora TaxID=1992 RepID=UPI0011B01A6E|nr:hypothetical protein [Thermomonospora echinospora]
MARPEAAPSWRDEVWPAAVVLTAAIVFVVLLVQTMPPLAVAMALVTLVAGGILITLVAGTAWITRLRPIEEPRH